MLPLSLLSGAIPGISQFSKQFSSLSFTAGTLALAFSIPKKIYLNIAICTFLCLSNLLHALLSGFKEPVIVSILVLGIFLYPFYKKMVFIVFIPLLFVLITVLPSYVGAFRAAMSSDSITAQQASDMALEGLSTQTKQEREETNWAFLTGRLSAISMFTQYVRSTPDIIDYYGLELLKQSLIVIVPRAVWPEKPITEETVMERIYLANVVDRESNVSAKPQVAVDAYLSGGTLGYIYYLYYIWCIGAIYFHTSRKIIRGLYSGLGSYIFRGYFKCSGEA